MIECAVNRLEECAAVGATFGLGQLRADGVEFLVHPLVVLGHQGGVGAGVQGVGICGSTEFRFLDLYRFNSLILDLY